MFNTLIMALQESELLRIVNPVIEVCSKIVPVLLTVVGSVGAIWCIILGVKFATATEQQDHEKAKKSLKNAIIGFVLIFVLLIALNVGIGVFTSWYKGSISA